MKTGSLDLRLLLVSAERETTNGVKGYFARTRAALSCTIRLEEALEKARGADGVLVFSDDYRFEQALSFVLQLRARVIVVVTADAERFRDSLRTTGSTTNVIVFRRPAWAWMLLEAVRDGRHDQDINR